MRTIEKASGRQAGSELGTGYFLEGFLILSFHFLHFIHRPTIGFSVKNERLITGKKKANSVAYALPLLYQQLLIFSEEKYY